jgi:cell division protein FtsI/penicillin-binding protein 2
VAETHGDTWRHTMKRRLAFVAAVAVLWSGAIQGRLIYLQVFQHADLTARANMQQSQARPIPAKRGDILDRNGRLLAYSVVADSIGAHPPLVEDAPAAAAALCRILDCDAREKRALEAQLSDRSKSFVWVRRHVSPDLADAIAALDLAGLAFSKEDRRYYPNRELAAHVLGYVGLDHTGLAGIEATYDDVIKGEQGRMRVQLDANGVEFNSRIEQPPTIGASLELTIDERYQHILERELTRGVQENHATAGTALMLDPRSGGVLAMASYPTFNPNAFSQASAEARQNRATQNIYEPGSTFKIVTASAAIEQGVVHTEDVIDVSGGRISFGPNDVIRDTQDYKALTFADVIVKSSNVGVIKVASKLGSERLTDYVRRFGFGRQASPHDFPGESRGIVRDPKKLRDSDLARVSIGYHVSVTPLQMAAAMSSIANGGQLIQPHVVRAVISGGERRVVPRTVVNRTVTPEVAAALTAIMEGVVDRGTARAAAIPGYAVAGKTGTATKWADGRYITTEHNASFVGFVPAHNPVYTILVVIDTPKGPNGYHGGPVAAPVFRRIGEAALHHAAVPRTFDAPPPVVARRQSGSPPQRTVSNPFVPPSIGSARADADTTVPDFSGLSARDALLAVSQTRLGVRMFGSGLVVRQEPAAGSPAEPGGRVSLWLARRAVEPPSSTLAVSRTP